MGANLATAESIPDVRLSGDRVEVLEASPGSIVVRPLPHHREGAIELSVEGARATAFYELPADFSAPPELRHPHPAAGLSATPVPATAPLPVFAPPQPLGVAESYPVVADGGEGGYGPVRPATGNGATNGASGASGSGAADDPPAAHDPGGDT